LDEVVKDIPMEYIILETDSPYLAPSPHRGKRNESAYMALVADKLAEVKRMRIEEVAAITTSNAKELFNL
jgi:TatD DNase family protein